MGQVPNKRLFLSPAFVYPMGAVTALIIAFLFYYFPVISRQQALLNDRAFRCLAAAGGQFKDLINNYRTVLETAGPTFDKDFLAHQVPNLRLNTKACSSKDVTSVDVLPSLDGYDLQFASAHLCAKVALDGALEPLLGGAANQIFDEILLTDARGTVLYQTRRTGIKADDLSVLFARGSEGETAKTKAPAGDSQGEVKADEKENTTKNSPGSPLLTARFAQFIAISGSSSLLQTTLGGTEYRVYLVPVPLTLQRAATDTGAALEADPGRVRFVLCGLMRQSRFRTESVSVPGTVLTAIALLFFLVTVGAWPLLKFATMRLASRIPRKAVMYYALCSTATVMLMIMLVVHVGYVLYDPATDNNLEDLAKAIDDHLGQEIESALGVMNVVMHSARFADPQSNKLKNLLKEPGLQLAAYPYFYRLNSYDGQGNEQVRWVVDTEFPPSIQASDRPYFKGVMRNDLWYLPSLGTDLRFRIDPVYSRKTGEYVAAIALPRKPAGIALMATPLLSLIGPVLPPDYGFAVIDASGKVLFHSEASRNGRENFFDECRHSEDLRAAVRARKQTFLDVDYLGFSHRLIVRPFTTVHQCPWSLVAFSNLSAVSGERVERMCLFAGLTVLYFVLIVLLSFVLGHLPQRLFSKLWPRKEQVGSYYHLSICLGLDILLFYCLIFNATPSELLTAAFLLPLISVLIAGLKLTSSERHLTWTAILTGALALLGWLWHVLNGAGWRWQPFLPLILISGTYYLLSLRSVTDWLGGWKRWSTATSFSLACFCLLVLVAGVPCVAFFKAAHDYEEELSTKREQLLTNVALEERRDRVISQYLRIKFSDQDPVFADDLAKQLFLQRRLNETTFDLYVHTFRDQRAGEVFSADKVHTFRDQRAGEVLSADKERKPPRLLTTLASWLPHFRGSLTQVLDEESPKIPIWDWRREGDNRIRMVRKQEFPTVPGAESSTETRALATLASNAPTLLPQDLAYDLELLQLRDFARVMAGPLLVLLFGIYWSARSTLRRMFYLDREFSNRWEEITLEDALSRESLSKEGQDILLGLPCSGRTKKLQQLEDVVFTIDLAGVIEKKLASLNSIDKPVVIDNFEFAIDDEEANRIKLKLLEDLIFVRKKKVIIITTVDPHFYLTSQHASQQLSNEPAARRDMDRWTRMLASFDQIRLLKDDSSIHAESRFRFLWQTCTRNEQIALYHLSAEGWANYRNHDAIYHLWRRRLIECSPFRFAPEHANFSKFILATVGQEERRLWELWEGAAVWDGLSRTFLILLGGLFAAVLFFNQQEILAYVTTGVSALTPVAKLLSEARGSRARLKGDQ